MSQVIIITVVVVVVKLYSKHLDWQQVFAKWIGLEIATFAADAASLGGSLQCEDG